MGKVPARTVGRRNQGCPDKLGTALLIAISTLGCGSGVTGPAASPPPSPTVSVNVTSPTSSVNLGASITVTPSVTGATNTSVTWSVNQVSGGNTAVGTITSAGVYTAPAIMPEPATATITATSVADASASGSVTLTITSGFAVMVSGPAALDAGAQGAFQAVFSPVAGANPNLNVTWSVSGPGCTGTTCGTIDTTTPGTTETAGASYTAPAIAPSPNSVVITATPLADPAVASSTTVTVNPNVQVQISPQTIQLPASGTALFQATVTGSANTAVTWDVNGTVGGDPGVGSITPSQTNPNQATYRAPALVPMEGSVAVDARSNADSNVVGTATVTFAASLSGVAISSLAPSSATAGASGGITLSITGADFVASSPGPGSTILIGGAPRATSCTSATNCTTSLAAADLATAGQLTIQVQNPDLTLSNAVAFVIVTPGITPTRIPLTPSAPAATSENIVVVDLSTAGLSTPAADVSLALVAIGAYDTTTETCALGGNSVPLLPSASGTATQNICAFSVSGLDPSYIYTLTGPLPADITISATAPLGLGIVQITLLVPSAPVTGARTLFVQNPALDVTAATGALDVQ